MLLIQGIAAVCFAGVLTGIAYLQEIRADERDRRFARVRREANHRAVRVLRARRGPRRLRPMEERG